MRRIALTLACGLLGCAGYTRDSGGLWNAGIGAALAATYTVAAIATSESGHFSCPESCPSGYGCNHFTGLCDHVPCENRCSSLQVCSVVGALETCVDATAAQPFAILPDWNLQLFPVAPLRR